MTNWTIPEDALGPARGGIGTRVAHDPGDPLITSHCPFCGSGQVAGRSDGTIGCDFCGQSYIVRVQPAFPGMPQMPGSPGAPSDAGPDGGLVDPGMVGPDGMPMDEGEGPPGDDDGVPPGADDAPPPGAGGGGGAPPPPGKGDDGKGPPGPKGDPKKKPPGKKGGLRYRGLHGEPLTEGQLIRHMAAALSGNHPSVLARLRAEASLSPREGHSGEYVPVGSAAELRAHMRQDHGVNPDMMDDATMAKLHDHDHARRDFGWEGSPDAARSPGFVARRA